MPTDPSKLMRNVGRRVAELRRQHGWTQALLAEKADVSIQYVRRIEAGRENLTLESIARLANLFKAAPAQLLAQATTVSAGRGRPPAGASRSKPDKVRRG